MLELKITADNDDPDELMRIKRAMLAEETFSVLYDIMAKLREIIKYENLDEKTYNKFEEFREFVIETLYAQGINLDYYYN